MTKVDNVKARARLLEERQCTAIEHMARTRAAFLRAFLSDIPDDVLAGIFTRVVDLPDDEWKESGRDAFNRERSSMPFVLAAVCSRWRRLALDLSCLWTYISLPTSDATQATAHCKRIELSLVRSKRSPMDIFLRWRDDDLYLASGDKDGMAWRVGAASTAMVLLAPHAWKLSFRAG